MSLSPPARTVRSDGRLGFAAALAAPIIAGVASALAMAYSQRKAERQRLDLEHRRRTWESKRDAYSRLLQTFDQIDSSVALAMVGHPPCQYPR